jgi:two-component system chemotaxis response regulator CheB
MKKLKLLIADDSVVYRSQIRNALAGLPWIEISGVASNGRLALERLQLSPVDLMILDLEMPEMDGIQTLREMQMRGLKCPVLVFSSVSKRGAESTLEALGLGATDFIAKPGGMDESVDAKAEMDPVVRIRNLLIPKILGLFPELQEHVEQVKSDSSPKPYPKVILDLFQPKVIVIGSSTGGPTVLETLFSKISGPLRCPIFITQHMPPIFTATLAERLQKISGIRTFEAKQDQVILQNAVYVAPGNYHMRVKNENGIMKIELDQGPLMNSVRPAVDPLFQSAAHIYGERCLGIVLTGMGADGRVGAERVKELGGVVLIQSEATCVVFGMPGAVMSVGAYDQILSPDEIVEVLREKVAAPVDVKLGRVYA